MVFFVCFFGIQLRITSYSCGVSIVSTLSEMLVLIFHLLRVLAIIHLRQCRVNALLRVGIALEI